LKVGNALSLAEDPAAVVSIKYAFSTG
jgi:hypothetical protein